MLHNFFVNGDIKRRPVELRIYNLQKETHVPNRSSILECMYDFKVSNKYVWFIKCIF